MLRPNSRSCRTASFRPGIAGGLTGELDSDVSRCQCMRHEMRQDEAFDSIWRVTKLEPDRQPTSGTGLMYRRVFPRAKPTGTENSKTKGCPGRGRKERSEIEVRQRAEQQAETRRVRWGSSMSTSQANYDGDFTYGDGTTGEYRGRTVVVESFSPNPWGLYQVHGNSYDWVEDCYHDSYRGSPSDGSAWISEDCSFHVARGGSWIDDPRSLRSAYKLGLATATRFRNLGFRVGWTLSR
jgi:hypothetical protein